MRRDPARLRASLAELEHGGLLRVRRRADAADGASVSVDGRRLVNFCSNDYLGLAAHPELAQALAHAAARHGVGSGASHLVSGHGIEHERLERALAAFTGRERALVFSSGYMANLGVIAALAGRGDVVLADRLNHASLIDAARLSGARMLRYAHGDACAAVSVLEAQPRSAGIVLATDGVFSMDGDLAPLPALAAAARAANAWLVLDDAHGFGVLGAAGGGSLEHFGLGTDDVPVLIGTFGKAFGTFGAFAAAEADVIEYLLQKARTYIYTTALPQALAAATSAALRLAERESWRRTRVLELTRRFRAAAGRAGIALADSMTPIQPVLLGEAARAVAASAGLAARGYWVAAIRPPTVPRASARLRITLSAAHAEAQVDGLVGALAEVLSQLPAAAPSEARA